MLHRRSKQLTVKFYNVCKYLLTSGGPVLASVHSEAVLLMTSLGSSHDTAKYMANERV